MDLMADPGALIPADVAGSHVEYDGSPFSASPLSRDVDSSQAASSSSGVGSSLEEIQILGYQIGNQSFGISVPQRNMILPMLTRGHHVILLANQIILACTLDHLLGLRVLVHLQCAE